MELQAMPFRSEIHDINASAQLDYHPTIPCSQLSLTQVVNSHNTMQAPSSETAATVITAAAR